MAGSTVSKTTHFALHRTRAEAPIAPPTGPGSERSKALFAVGEPSIGVMLPKRWAKRAVTRNAIKRQIYAVSLDFEGQLPPAPHVVRLRSAFDRRAFVSAESTALKQAVRGELQQLFTGAGAKAGA